MNSISNSIKEFVKISFAIGYAAYLKVFNDKQRKLVINYHSINKDCANGFRMQMKYLSENYKVVRPSEIMDCHTNEDISVVAITIDDAFENFLEIAMPILREYGLTAGLFAPVANLGYEPMWDIPEWADDKNELIMTEQQLLEVERYGFDVFSHSYSHPRLTMLESESMHAEIAGSKTHLEDLLGHEVVAISYPHGDHDERVCNAVMEAGYLHGFTVEPAMIDDATDCFRIGRFEVSPSDSLFKFKLKCSGAYHTSSALSVLKSLVIKNNKNRGRQECLTR